MCSSFLARNSEDTSQNTFHVLSVQRIYFRTLKQWFWNILFSGSFSPLKPTEEPEQLLPTWIFLSVLYLLSSLVAQWWRSHCNTSDVVDMSSITGLQRSQEKGMSTCPSFLAWRIPGTEEPGGLQSMGLQSWTRLTLWLFFSLSFIVLELKIYQISLISL